MIASFILLVCIVVTGSPVAAQTPAPKDKPVSAGGHSSGELVSSKRYKAPAAVKSDARLLIYYMPSVQGGMTQASTLLFVPQGTPPAGGFPVVAWAHGTTTAGQKARAPSLSPTLDGDLTKDGFDSNYVFVIATFVNAGYAVVAPDFEGLGKIASVPYPYFNAASSARSLIFGVRAARQADSRLSNRFAVVGHSEGGHAVLGVEAFAAEAPELILKGTVAYAPYMSIADSVSTLSEMAVRDPGKSIDYIVQQNVNVAVMATGLAAQSPAFDPGSIMGSDLEMLLPNFKTKGVIKIIADVKRAVTAKTPTAFSGFKTGWNTVPEMNAFLAANDPAATPGFNLRIPTLVVQGTNDVSVLEPLTAAFTSKLIAKDSPITYRKYAGADHSTVITVATPEVLTFLAERLR